MQHYLIFNSTPEGWAQDPKVWDKLLGTYHELATEDVDGNRLPFKPQKIKLHENLLGGREQNAAVWFGIAYVKLDGSPFTEEELAV